MEVKLAPISPLTNLPPPPCDVPLTTTSTNSIEDSTTAVDLTTEEDPLDDPLPLPPTISSFSSLPVALVVEQTARILEDIKRKIQLQKEEEERQKRERELSPVTAEDSIFNSKSFIILKNAPPSLSPDSGTDYGPFSASSSISPPFLSSSVKDRENTFVNSLTPSRPHSENFKFPSYSLPFAAIPPSLSPPMSGNHKNMGEFFNGFWRFKKIQNFSF